jgi:quercetin dioxygenase-like cupin family protein
VTAFVRDWNALPSQQMRAGVNRVGVGTENVSVQIATLHPGAETNPHSHPYEQVALFLSGEGYMWVGEHRFAIGPRSVVVVPPDVVHYVEVTSDEPIVNIDIFAPARPDLAELFSWMRPEGPA